MTVAPCRGFANPLQVAPPLRSLSVGVRPARWGTIMRILGAVLAAAVCCASAQALAVEGSSVAGPIGGTDMRSSLPLPPGLYGGMVFVGAEALQFTDGAGHVIPALSGLKLDRGRAGAFLIYVPDAKVLGGTLTAAGFLPLGIDCGHLFAATPDRCTEGLGDPYVEVNWSRYFGTLRPSRDPGAFPIPEGLAISVGLGTEIPAGRYDASDATTRAVSTGNNVWDFAPIVGFTYTTRPIIAEGTEITGRLFWNNYLTNPATQYTTGSLLNLDFAVSEHIGRVQAGLAGVYLTQLADDRQFGVPLLPDGRRIELLQFGPVLAYDLPLGQASLSGSCPSGRGFAPRFLRTPPRNDALALR
jgi:hypothetical protein